MIAAPIRSTLADDSQLVRQLVRLGLVAHGVVVVAEATSVDELLLLCRAEAPDIVLSAPHIGGVSVAHAIGELRRKGVDVLVLAAEASSSESLTVLRAGAVGYVTRDLTVDALADAIRAARAGGCPLDPRCAAAVLQEWRGSAMPSPEETAPDLSPRESEVLALLARGSATKTIAAELGLSAKTVENHKTRIFSKLGVRTRTEAVAVAISLGIFDIDGQPNAQAAP